MLIAKVTSTVVATIKNVDLEGYKLLMVQPLDLMGNPSGSDMLALDCVDSGKGDIVLINVEGGFARLATGKPKTPARAMIVGIIDDIDIFDEQTKKEEKLSSLIK